MPAPDHLIPLLTALGNGGTVATATAVAAAAGGLPGQVPAPTVDTVMGALGDGGTRDVAGRVVDLYNGFTMTLPGPDVDPELPGDDTAPVVNESVEPVTAELAEAIAASAAGDTVDLGDFTQYADSDDDWEPSGLDEFVADPKPTPEADLMPLAASAAAVRAWAKANGVKVPARGAIPQDVRDAYNAAQEA